MCGIFGWLKVSQSFAPEDISRAQVSLRSMQHRGPDARGEWTDKNVYLGHNRLSIIDLSEEANQPFADESGRYVLVFNGEIYNYIELRAELVRQGHRFRTNSDTEVILKAFIVFGEQAFVKLDGMFAFALFDQQAQRIYLVRDFLGQKPLYYYDTPDELMFGSELRAFLSLPDSNWQLDKKNIYRFLLNSCFMGETTPLVGVKKLSSGHFLVKDARGTVIQKFWDSVPGEKTLKISPEDALARFEELFDASCRISLRADVPCGVFLSGGLDSSLVLESCRKVDPDIAAFTVQMGERDFDESAKGKIVCQQLGIAPAKQYLMDTSAVQSCLDAYCSFLDEPHGDPGFVNAFFLAQSCCRDIKVGLAGDGADELFAGYLPFKIMSLGTRFDSVNAATVAQAQKFVKKFIPCSDSYMGMQFKLLSFLDGFPSRQETRLPLWLGAISPEELAGLCPGESRDFFSRSGDEGTLLDFVQKKLSPVEDKTIFDKGLYFYQKFFLPEYVCMHTDRAAMQNSLEVRSPFLSVGLIEFANQLPLKIKMNHGQLKVLLRESLQRKNYPRSIYRQSKRGFTFPVSRWMKTVMRSRLEQAFAPGRRIFDLVDRVEVDRLLFEHLNNQRNNYRILFNLLVLSNWLDKYPAVK